MLKKHLVLLLVITATLSSIAVGAPTIPPPIEEKHPAVGHSLEGLARQAREIKESVNIGKPAVDIQRTTQEITRMRNIWSTLCSSSAARSDLKTQGLCESVKNDLIEAQKNLKEHHLKLPVTG